MKKDRANIFFERKTSERNDKYIRGTIYAIVGLRRAHQLATHLGFSVVAVIQLPTRHPHPPRLPLNKPIYTYIRVRVYVYIVRIWLDEEVGERWKMTIKGRVEETKGKSERGLRTRKKGRRQAGEALCRKDEPTDSSANE